MSVGQTLVASIDVVLSSLVVWVLLLGQVDIDFGAFVVAQVVGVISQVPGGIGVFESAFLWLMSSIEASDQHLILIGALLLYRAVYYFLPLLLAGCGLLGYEIYSRRSLIVESTTTVRGLLSAIVPTLFSVAAASGAILLVSGAIPFNPDSLDWSDLVPLPVIELSHLTGSLTGLLLLFLARSIRCYRLCEHRA